MATNGDGAAPLRRAASAPFDDGGTGSVAATAAVPSPAGPSRAERLPGSSGRPADTEARPAPAHALELADAIADAVAALGDLLPDCADWPAADRRGVLSGLDRAVDGLATLRGAVLVAERRSGAWEGAGDRSFEAWRARTSRLAQGSAAAQVRQAEQLGTVPAAAAAVAAGRINLEHAASIAKVAATGTPAQQAAVLTPTEQEHLLGLAERVDAGTFARTVARWASTVDPEALERDHEAQRRERFLTVTESSRGTFLKGRLDSMAGRRVVLALEALCPRPGADDERDPGQRRADALDAMAGRILAQADTRPGGHVPPQISMIVTAETWAGARAELARRRAAAGGDGAAAGARACGLDGDRSEAMGDGAAGYAPATLEDGTPVSVSELAAAMCDCEVTRIVVDADGIPLDLGRTQRLFTREQRRAVIARDRECAWPQCPAHARWCDVHHIDWWDRDTGPTSVTNGVLLCSYHHHEVHRRDLTIERLPIPRDASPPGAGRGVPDGIALAGYVVRDRAGHPVGRPPPVAAREHREQVEDPDEAEPTWATDPVTGERVLSWFT